MLLQQHEGDVVITGSLSDLSIGDFVHVNGAWVSHPVHKQQFKVSGYSQLIPTTNEDLTLFLSTGVITGIGPHFAKMLVDTFGDQLVSILDQTPDRLLSVSGIGQTKLNQIKQSWKAQREQLSFLTFVMERGLDMNLGKRIWREFYSDAFEVCNQRPYDLISRVTGMSFAMADQLAPNDMQDSDARLMAGVHDVFSDYFKSAHVWMPFDLFFKQLQNRLKWADDVTMDRCQTLIFQQQLAAVQHDDQRWVTSQQYQQMEYQIMDRLDQLQALAPAVSILPDKAVDWVAPLLKNPMATDQTAALLGLLQHPVSVLYGGPGTGKTSMLHALVKILAKKTDRIVCMAPTGKAAKRLGDQVGRRASTIHAMMEYDEKAHTLTPKALDCDVCIVDEMSMVDMPLFLDVLTMLAPGTRLILVGDPDQLPSIGPGQIFSDIIKHSGIPSFKLTTNHRQVSHRGITSLATAILNRQTVPDHLGNDLTMIQVAHDDELEATVLDLFLHRLQNESELSMNDIQILVPIHKGRFGISNLNQVIANRVRGTELPPQKFMVGDRVIQCRNNYSKRVMNGDIGYIKRITNDATDIEFQHGSVSFETADMLDVQLAYAVSIHKFQGSEAPVIILPLIKQWGFFMSMDVLYTAVTRAKSHLFVVGDLRVLNQMIETSKKTERHTQLFQS